MFGGNKELGRFTCIVFDAIEYGMACRIGGGFGHADTDCTLN